MAGEKIRYREIDIARGFGIILVVAGHAIKQTGVSARWIRILTFLIYSFHMPLFFLLSGFVAAKILRMELMRERLSYIRDRALRLLVPYFTVSLLYIPVKLKLSAYAELPFTEKDILKILIGRSPDVALWFLFILFVVSAITALFVNQINFRQFLYGAFVLSGVFYWLNIDVRTMKYWFFFLFGIWVRLKFEDAQKEGIRDVMGGQFIGAFLIGIFYLAAVLFWYRTAIMISCFLTSLSGIYLTLWLSTRIEHYQQPEKLRKYLLYLGGFSMDIYILHEPILTALKLILWNRLALNYILVSLLLFLMALLLPIPIGQYIIRPVRLFRFLFLGEWAEKERSPVFLAERKTE